MRNIAAQAKTLETVAMSKVLRWFASRPTKKGPSTTGLVAVHATSRAFWSHRRGGRYSGFSAALRMRQTKQGRFAIALFFG
ncbi:uncharacterized protein PG998_013421 [Apiospora kogelbergensis]|uniref:Uncharacterized protein n=1 Tax=Apiospora kogelbergensis TaxID=1337665 RepID=A0AAW0R1I9_9PEZI